MFHQPFPHLSDAERGHCLDDCLANAPGAQPLWVFSYGSLLWRPCYTVRECLVGVLQGYVRQMCIWTIEARGTPAQPGLGLGLLASSTAQCVSHLHRIGDDEREQALAALWDREMLTGIYQPAWVNVDVDGDSIQALTFVVDSGHMQFAGHLDASRQVELIASAHGVLGSNADYLDATVAALRGASVEDEELAALNDAVQATV